MAGDIPISLIVEDELSEHLLRALLLQTKRDYLVGAVYGRKGSAYLRQKLSAFNLAARGSAYLMMTDLDRDDCAPSLISKWFDCDLVDYPKRRHPNMLFRIAIQEAESWVMADRERFATFLGVSSSHVPDQLDGICDPKEFLLKLAAGSRSKSLRYDLVPQPGDKRKIGPDYNGRLAQFIHSSWRAVVACSHSASLARTWKILTEFRPVYKINKTG